MSDILGKRRSIDPSGAGTPPPMKRMRAPTGNSAGTAPKQEMTGTTPQAGGFVELQENLYSGDVSKESLLANYQPSWCKCSTAVNGGVCGSDCTNRRNRVECDPTLCVAGDKCSNQVIQRRSIIQQLEVVSRDGQPILISQNAIPQGCFILQYTGEVMSSQSFQQRVASYGNRPTFCLPMTRDLVIDASIKGSVCRYVRHSVQPTAEMVRWKAGGLDCMVLFSVRNINQGEEITFDPSKVTFDDHTPTTSEARCTVCREALGNQMAGGEDFSIPHPLLGVAICGKCLLVYSEREWMPDQNGKDTFCRWCSQAGNLLVCHSCPMSFCKKCLKSNLGHKIVRQAEMKAENWQCIVCDSSSLDKLRGIVSGATQPQTQGQEAFGLGNLFEEQKPTLTPVRRQRGGATGQRGRGAGMGVTSTVRTPALTQCVPPSAPQGTPGSRPGRGAGYKGTPRPARGQMSLARETAPPFGRGASVPGRGTGAPVPGRGSSGGAVPARGLPQTRGRGGIARGGSTAGGGIGRGGSTAGGGIGRGGSTAGGGIGRGGSTVGGRGSVSGIRPVSAAPTPVNNQLMGALAKSGISVSRQVVKQPSASNNNASMAKLQQALPRGISIVAVSESTTQCNELLKEVEEVANSIKEEAGNLRRDRDKQINAKEIKHLVMKAQRKLEDLAMKM